MYPIPSKRMVYVVLKARGLLVYNRKHAVLPVVISCSTRHFITAFQRMKHALCIRYLLPVVVPVQIDQIAPSIRTDKCNQRQQSGRTEAETFDTGNTSIKTTESTTDHHTGKCLL